jgi:hypothetical protein
MPRNTQKLSNLLEQINKQKLEIEKYKQLINSINGLIAINGIKLNEDDYIDLLSDLPRDRKASTYNLSTDELAQALTARLDKEGLKLFITRNGQEQQEAINKAVFKEPTPTTPETTKSRQLDSIKKQAQSHVDELKEAIDEQAEAGEQYPKPSKAKIPTNINEVIEQEKQRQAEAPKTEEKPKVNIEDLPIEAKAIIASNKARMRAAEREKDHGADGDREYNRLTQKEKIEKGELPAGGNCPHCGEKLEAPITRGYHAECWEAKQQRETEK